MLSADIRYPTKTNARFPPQTAATFTVSRKSQNPLPHNAHLRTTPPDVNKLKFINLLQGPFHYSGAELRSHLLLQPHACYTLVWIVRTQHHVGQLAALPLRYFCCFFAQTQNIEQHGRTRKIRHECGCTLCRRYTSNSNNNTTGETQKYPVFRKEKSKRTDGTSQIEPAGDLKIGVRDLNINSQIILKINTVFMIFERSVKHEPHYLLFSCGSCG